MSKPAEHPIAYVYIHYTAASEGGVGHIARYVVPHDGVLQASEDAIRALGFDPAPPGIRIREIEVFGGVEPRRFYYEPTTRRSFSLKEAP